MAVWKANHDISALAETADALAPLCDVATNLYRLDMRPEDALDFWLEPLHMLVDIRIGGGMRLGDYHDMDYLRSVLPQLQAAKAVGKPTISKVHAEVLGHLTVYQRMLLPFHQDGQVVECLSISMVLMKIKDIELANPTPLTPRERQCMGYLAEGLTAKEIAVEMVLSVKTVEKHIDALRARLGAKTTAQAVAKGMWHLMREVIRDMKPPL